MTYFRTFVEPLVRRLGWTDPQSPPRTPKFGSFADTPEMSHQLLQLVRDGVKKATASLRRIGQNAIRRHDHSLHAFPDDLRQRTFPERAGGLTDSMIGP